MKRSLRALTALALACALPLAGCASQKDATSRPSASASTQALDDADLEAVDGRARLDEIREVTEQQVPASEADSQVSASDATVETVMAENQKPHAGGNDADVESIDTSITLDGTTASGSGDGLEITSGNVMLTKAGTYSFSGTYSGQIFVNTEDSGKVRIVLDGMQMQNDAPAIQVLAADEVVIVLADGSENTLSGGATEPEDGPAGVISSKADLTIGGTGSLTVSAEGGNAIASSDGLAIIGGDITVDAADDGIHGKDYVVVAAGTLTISAGGDALQATNEEDAGRGYVYLSGGAIEVTKADKAIDAVSDVIVDGAQLSITSTGDSMEGASLLLAAGKAQISSADDAVNAVSDAVHPWLAVSGGEWTFFAEGDGVDSNGAGVIRDGTVTVFGPRNAGNGAIDVQDGLVMAGGVLWASGSQGMDEAPVTSSAQAALKFNGMQLQAGSEVGVLDSDGNEVFALTVEKEASSVVFSSADVSAGKEYTLSVGGTQVATAVAGEYSQAAGPGGGAPGMQGGQGGPGGAAPDGQGGGPGGQGAPGRPGEPQGGDQRQSAGSTAL